MKYDLALVLKNNGFPQKGNPKDLEMAFKYFGKEEVYLPTLSELIEACGEDFLCVGRNSSGWYAFALVNGIPKELAVECVSPDEAVSRLWLALNK